jgi:hypothetical protein
MDMLKKIKIYIGIYVCMPLCIACSDFLNVVPDDGIATLESAFTMRSEAERYLYTCYSYLPQDGMVLIDPGILAGDEFWSVVDPGQVVYNDRIFRIARGFQNAQSPLCGWNWLNLYQAIRVCNIFLENAGSVPDLTLFEKERWVAEATFLKAYYHFYLLRMYGPIPLVKENLPISAPVDQVKVFRDPADDCFAYIVELLDEAIPHLPPVILNPQDEMGRITQPIAAALKAKILVTAASPLFNGNNDQATLANKNGVKLFNPDVLAEKWEVAAQACREAIEICHEANIVLYKYETILQLSDTIKREMTVRNTFALKWNSETIWANTQSNTTGSTGIQQLASPNLDADKYPDNWSLTNQLAPPLKIAEMYYTNHGIPIEEDKDWQGVDLFSLRNGTDAERYYIKKDYTTIQLHFDREPRFYACLGFDGGIWYGHSRYGNNPNDYYYLACRIGGLNAKKSEIVGPYTGYYWKKCVYFENVQTSVNGYTATRYPWPIIRLSDLYLLYAEAINEAEGPNGPHSADLFRYIDDVRKKTDLEGVKESYNKYAINRKYETKNGMREIIHRERLIELSLEGQRFWDLRRWKEAPAEYAKNIVGYKLLASKPEEFYQRVVLAVQPFSIRDYFWPIETAVIERNPNLVQNIGW